MELREQLILAGIRAEDFDKVKDTEAAKFGLINLKGPLAQVMDVWLLHQPDEWAYLKLIEAFYLEEYKLLEQARKVLRREWRKFFHIANKEIKDGKSNSTTEAVTQAEADKTGETCRQHGSSSAPAA